MNFNKRIYNMYSKIRKLSDDVKIDFSQIISSHPIQSLVILAFGVIVFYSFINDKKIGGGWALFLTAICYFSLGIGLYGISSWLIVKTVRLIFFIIKLIWRGEIQLTITGNKVNHKIIYK